MYRDEQIAEWIKQLHRLEEPFTAREASELFGADVYNILNHLKNLGILRARRCFAWTDKGRKYLKEEMKIEPTGNPIIDGANEKFRDAPYRMTNQEARFILGDWQKRELVVIGALKRETGWTFTEEWKYNEMGFKD